MSELARAFFAWYAEHELPGIFLFLLVEEMGVPLLIPGDTLIIVAGARDRTVGSAMLVIGASALAAALGSSILYELMRRGGRPLLDRYGPYVHLNPRRVALLESQFRRHGALAIVVGRLVPGFRTPTTIMAGIFGVPYRTFVPSTTVAAIIWSATYFYLGAALQRGWRRFATMLLANERLVVGIAVGLVLAGVLVWLVAQRLDRLRRQRTVDAGAVTADDAARRDDDGGSTRQSPPGSGTSAQEVPARGVTDATAKRGRASRGPVLGPTAAHDDLLEESPNA